MRPAKHSGETSSLELYFSCMVRMSFYYFRLLFVSVDKQCFVFNRFHSMTKKLCSPLTQR